MAPHCDVATRIKIIELRAAGHTLMDITRLVGKSKRTVMRWLRKWEREGNIDCKVIHGRPHAFTDEQIAELNRVRRERNATIVELARYASENMGIQVCRTTLSRSLFRPKCDKPKAKRRRGGTSNNNTYVVQPPAPLPPPPIAQQEAARMISYTTASEAVAADSGALQLQQRADECKTSCSTDALRSTRRRAGGRAKRRRDSSTYSEESVESDGQASSGSGGNEDTAGAERPAAAVVSVSQADGALGVDAGSRRNYSSFGCDRCRMAREVCGWPACAPCYKWHRFLERGRPASCEPL